MMDPSSLRLVQRLLFLICIVFLVPTKVQAGTWARAYYDFEQDYNYYPAQIVRTNDGNYAALVTDTIIKINPDGRILSQKKIFPYWQFLRKTRDGGFLIARNTDYLTDGSTTILKLSKALELVWAREISIAYEIFVYARDLNETADGGVIVAGNTYYFVPASTLTSKAQPYNAWLAKLDRSGNLEWKFRYNMKMLTTIRQTQDRDYVAATAGGSVVKFDSLGIPQWQKKYGDFSSVLELTQDSGIILATSNFKQPVRVLKLKSDGEILWQKKYQAKDNEQITKIRISNTGEIFLAGHTGSYRSTSIIAYKLNPTGMLIWKHTYGLPEHRQETDSIIPTTDGGLLVGAKNWILKTDANGEIENLCNDIIRSEASTTQDAFLHGSSGKPSIRTFSLQASSNISVSISEGNVRERTICTPVILGDPGFRNWEASISGRGFGNGVGNSKVILNGKELGPARYWRDDAIYVPVQDDVVTGILSVSVNNILSNSKELVVLPDEETIRPVRGTAGTRVALRVPDGMLSDFIQEVRFGPSLASSLSSIGDYVLAVSAPSGSGTVSVILFDGNKTQSIGSFTYK